VAGAKEVGRDAARRLLRRYQGQPVS
jgi:hypothetical protein